MNFASFLALLTAFEAAEGLQEEPLGNVINLNYQRLEKIYVQSDLLTFGNETIKVPPRSKLSMNSNCVNFLNISSKNLVQVDARHSNISQVKVISDNLHELRLDHNELEVLSADMISSHHLGGLSLSNNKIFAIRSNTFNKLPSLRSLDLSHNQIVTLVDDLFVANLLLDSLDLSHNKIVTLHLAFAGSTLFLAFNKLTEDDKFLDKMPYLTYLDLTHNELTRIPFFVSLTLEYLGLRGNNLSYVTLTNFDTLPSLEFLDIRDNQFTDAFHPKVFKFSNIKELRLEGNPWKCKCDRTTYKLVTFLKGPPARVEDFATLKCSHNGQTWTEECNRKWLRFQHLTGPIQQFVFGCFAFVMALLLSIFVMVLAAKLSLQMPCIQNLQGNTRSSRERSPPSHSRTPDAPPNYEDAVKYFTASTKETDPPKYEELELQRLSP